MLFYAITIVKLGARRPAAQAPLSHAATIHPNAQSERRGHRRRRSRSATLGLSFAAVPFYFAFCRATGFAGTTQVAEHGVGRCAAQRMLKVRFNANVAPGLDWSFEPETESVDVRTGATRPCSSASATSPTARPRRTPSTT